MSSSCRGVSVSPATDLQGLIDAYGPGTTFCLQPGVYRLSRAIVPKSHDRIQGAPGSVLNGSKVVTGFVQSGSYWVAVAANTGVVIRGNHLHHNGQYGIVGSAADILVENNEIAFNNTEGFDPKWDAGGSKFSRTTNLRLIGNHVHDNYGPGLAADADNRATLYERNTVRANTGPGIVHEISYTATVRGNVLENNASATAGKSIWWGADLLMYDAVDVDIYDNAITSRNNAVGLVDIARGSGPYGTYETRNVRVHDNEIRMASGTTGLVGSDATFSKGNSFQNNRYHLADLAGRYFEWRGTTALDRREWQAQGQDTTGSFGQL